MHRIKQSYPGMAHFAGTADVAASCRKCKWFPYDEKQHKAARSCGKFRQLTGKIGKPIPPTALACKYFEVGRT